MSDAVAAVAPDGSRPEIAPALAPWRLYCLGAATLGLYLVAWVYRVASCDRSPRLRRPAPWAWAAGSLAAPIACAVLYDTALRARLARGASPGWLPASVALLHGALAAAFLWSPLGGLFAALAALLPLPFVLVQREINLCERAREIPATSRRFSWPQRALLCLAAPALALAVWAIDRPTLSEAMLGRERAGAIVRGASAGYSLSIPGDGWRRAFPGSLGDADAELQLRGPGTDTWVVSYFHSGSNLDVDGVVANRRALIDEAGALSAFEESRSFLPESDLIVVSRAHYRLDLGIAGRIAFEVLTAQLAEGIVEVIGYTNEPDARLADLGSFLDSFTTAPGETQP